MGNNIECTLLADGSSDKILISPIKWLMRQKFPGFAVNLNFADLRPILKGNENLPERMCLALELFPCDILMVHRDVENQTYEEREEEIRSAMAAADCSIPVVVPVIPCRMSEAWFILDAEAIRIASGNPNGSVSLKLPPVSKLEKLSDPKKELISLLKTATELNNRRLKKFRARQAIHRLAEMLEDYSLLRRLESFRKLEEELEKLNLKQEE